MSVLKQCRDNSRWRPLRMVMLLSCAGVLAACSDPAVPDPPPPPPPPPSGPPVYTVLPPDGKLPWPHHDPAWDSTTYLAKLDSLWVLNNYGAYTGTSDRSVLYLHDAWDLMLPNGTPIYR